MQKQLDDLSSFHGDKISNIHDLSFYSTVLKDEERIVQADESGCLEIVFESFVHRNRWILEL